MIFIVWCVHHNRFMQKITINFKIHCMQQIIVEGYCLCVFFLHSFFELCCMASLVISRFHYFEKTTVNVYVKTLIRFLLLSSIKWSMMGSFKMRTISQHQKLNWNTHSFYVYKNWTPIYIQIVVNVVCFFSLWNAVSFQQTTVSWFVYITKLILIVNGFLVCFMVREKGTSHIQMECFFLPLSLCHSDQFGLS